MGIAFILLYKYPVDEKLEKTYPQVIGSVGEIAIIIPRKWGSWWHRHPKVSKKILIISELILQNIFF